MKGRRLGYDWTDLLVILACSLAFAVVVSASKQSAPKHPPITLIAQDLGTTPEQFQHAVKQFAPNPRMGPPTISQRRQIAGALDILVEQLDTVMAKYRPDRLDQQ